MSPLQAVAEGGSSSSAEQDERFGAKHFMASPNTAEEGAEGLEAPKDLVGEDSFEAAMRGL